MASQTDETSFGIWNNSDLWNSLGHSSGPVATWSPNNNKSQTFSKLYNDASKLLERAVDHKSDDSAGKTAVWPPVGPLVSDVDIPSIWSNADLFCNDQSLSLSSTSTPWAPLPSGDNEMADISAACQLWNSSEEPVFHVSGGDDTWKADKQSTPEPVQSVTITDTYAVASNNQSTQFSSDYLPRVQGLTLTLGDELEQPTTTISSVDTSQSTAVTTDQLYDHLINSNDGWGRRPVDQFTPWDLADLARLGEQFGRSGLTTPTPGHHPSGSSVSLRAIETQAAESNVWTNEPPTGTGIWEMYYDNCGTRTVSWNTSLSGCATPVFRPIVDPLYATGHAVNMKSVPIASLSNISRSNTQKPWEQADKIWNPTIPVNGRPVLGGSRNANASEDTTGWLCSGPPPIESSRCIVDSTNGPSAYSWDSLANPNVSHWNHLGSSSVGMPSFLHNGMDELRRVPGAASNMQSFQGDRSLLHPFGNAYRADLVKCLTNQGFKKEDVQAALIDYNMDADRALQDLRERYSGGYSLQQQQQQQQSSSQLQALCNLASGVNSGSGGVGPTTRNKPGAPGVSSTNHSFLPSGSPANPHLIRQQLTQQVRSALNLPLPNPHGSLSGTGNHSVINATGNSLLGQPPPLVSGTGFVLGFGNNTGSSLGASASHIRTINGNSGNPRFAPNNTSSFIKRSDRQISIMAAIQELQKKHQSIQQQLFVYRNNPTICSQPQYADVFTELQGQLHQIEAQLRAKQTQLNIACAQDSAASARGHSFHSPVDGPVLSTAQHSQTGRSVANRFTQDQLVQQLMELRIRPGNTDTDVDGEFPTIGTWTAQKSSQDNQDKASLQDNPASRSSNIKPNGSKCQNNWSSNGWQPGINNRPANNWANGLRRAEMPQSVNTVDSFHPITGGTDRHQHQSTSVGQWLLIHSPFTGGFCSSLHMLHGLLSQFGMTHFHVLGPSSGSSINGCSIIVRLQSPECALQLIRAVGDRLSVEPISDHEAISQLQHDKFVGPRSDQFVNELNSNMSSINSAQPNWLNPDQYGLSSQNSNAQLIPKRVPVNGVSRTGVMVSGFH